MAYLGATVAASAAAAAQQRVIEQFRGKLALSHERATSFAPAQKGDERWLESLLDRGVVVEAAPGRYWLNERPLKPRTASKRVLLAVIAALLALMLGAILVGWGLGPA